MGGCGFESCDYCIAVPGVVMPMARLNAVRKEIGKGVGTN